MIVPEFNRLARDCTIAFVANSNNAPLLDFCNYCRRNWIYGSRFSISDFCQFKARHRTNNVAEAYHSQLRRRNFSDNMNTLSLISRLWQEGQDIPSLMDDFFAGRGKKTSKQSRHKEELLDTLWDQLEHGLIDGRFFFNRLLLRKVIVADPQFAQEDSCIDLE